MVNPTTPPGALICEHRSLSDYLTISWNQRLISGQPHIKERSDQLSASVFDLSLIFSFMDPTLSLSYKYTYVGSKRKESERSFLFLFFLS